MGTPPEQFPSQTAVDPPIPPWRTVAEILSSDPASCGPALPAHLQEAENATCEICGFSWPLTSADRTPPVHACYPPDFYERLPKGQLFHVAGLPRPGRG